jgi:DNA-binding PadR family transcriptional regulator
MERELLLLGLLRRQNMHGYELHEFIESYMQTCVDLKKPTAYYLLGKLAEAGYVDESSEHSGNRPPRKVYRITEAGEAHFQTLLRDNLAAYTPARFADLVGIAFLDEIGAGEAAMLLQARRQLLLAELARLQIVPTHPGSLQLLIAHQTLHLQSEINWLDSVLAGLNDS